jgi:hypothetical protein
MDGLSAAIHLAVAHGRWADARLLDAAARLTPEQFTAPSAGGESIRDVLIHVLASALSCRKMASSWSRSPGPEQAAPRARHHRGDDRANQPPVIMQPILPRAGHADTIWPWKLP